MTGRTVIVPNPDFVGPPRLLEPVCHDRSPFISVQCSCGDQMHLHESQLDALPSWVAFIDSRCHQCGQALDLRIAELRAAFAEMRSEGWIR